MPPIGWEAELRRALRDAVSDDAFWGPRLAKLQDPKKSSAASLHLAVFVEPYLEFVLTGKKTIESRFGVRRTPPYQTVRRWDVILLKRASGPIVGICEVANVWFYELDPVSWGMIRRDFAVAICPQDGFWDARKHASFATLIRVANVTRLPPISCAKRDRRGWVILSSQREPSQLGLDLT